METCFLSATTTYSFGPRWFATMLIDPENQPGNQVYYIAPGFADVSTLDSSYTTKQVITHSAMFSPREIGILPDDEDHCVSFRPGEPWGWFLSEPKQIAVHNKETVLALARERPLAQNGNAVRESLSELASKMENIIGEHRGRREQVIERELARRDPVERVAYLARTHFGAEPLLPAEPRSSARQS
jgi:hypothetical protein